MPEICEGCHHNVATYFSGDYNLCEHCATSREKFGFCPKCSKFKRAEQFTGGYCQECDLEY